MDTTTINLRNIPNDMAKRAKSRAALEGVSLKDFCMAAIAQAVIDSEKGGENHGPDGYKAYLGTSGSGGSASTENTQS